ncbi:MAG: class I SAM-dependent methyltransferase [Pseudomonadota bacterium]
MKTNPDDIKGDQWPSFAAEIGESDEHDHKIRLVLDYVHSKDVLDVGCVHHNPEKYKSKFWLHKAIKKHARKLIGIDLYRSGLSFLQEKGFDVRFADACDFDLDRKFDVITTCDIIEHLVDVGGFLESVSRLEAGRYFADFYS